MSNVSLDDDQVFGFQRNAFQINHHVILSLFLIILAVSLLGNSTLLSSTLHHPILRVFHRPTYLP